jgi:hypothetical protein
MGKLNAREQEDLVRLLTNIYKEIREIELSYGIIAGSGDMRPRIDYFHDAIRAFTAQSPEDYEKGGRLSIEYLSYDASCLRYIIGTPTALIKSATKSLSPHAKMIRTGENLPSVPALRRPERAVREKLSELYTHYAILFSALLKVPADQNYQSRLEDHNELYDQLAEFEQQAGQATKNTTLESLDDVVNLIEDPELRNKISQIINRKQSSKNQKLQEALEVAREAKERIDREIAVIESAHMGYVMAQLGIYEDGKDTLKQLAQRGMNLVGKFVEAALAEARRDLGRG